MMQTITPNMINWPTVGGALYSYWFVAASAFGLITWLLRSPIAKHTRNFAGALRSAKEQVRKIEALTDKLAEARGRADEWRDRFSEMERRHQALQAELSRLGEDMREFRQRMTTAESLVRVLTRDRDALVDFTRLLIGQLYSSGKHPDYPTPPLESMVDVPGPPLPPYPDPA